MYITYTYTFPAVVTRPYHHRDRRDTRTMHVNSRFDILLTNYVNSCLLRVQRVERTNGKNFNEEDSET